MNIENRFKNYPQPDDYTPNNWPKPRRKFELTIMTGETSVHRFEIPFSVDAFKNIEVIYKCGLDIKIVKDYVPNNEFGDVSIEPSDCENFSIVSCTLSPEETMEFEDTYLDTNVQLRFTMNAGGKYSEDDIIFSEIYHVDVEDSLIEQ